MVEERSETRYAARWQRLMSRYWSGLLYRLRELGWLGGWPMGLGRDGLWTRLPQARLPFARLRQQTDRNIWYLYLDMFFAGIFMAAVAFNAAFALRLGASNTMIGWLSSIPSLLAMAVLVPAARFLETKSNRAPWLRRGLFLGRFAFLGAAIVPWILPRYAAEGLVAVLIVRTIPMHFYSAGFSPMLADIIPERDRALVVANRSMIMSATVAVFTVLYGRWMDLAGNIAWAKFPVNYQIVYIVGGVAGLLSTYFVSRITMPTTRVVSRQRPKVRQLPDFSRLRQATQTMVRENQEFVRITVNTLVFDFGAWLVGPLYMILFINQLNASDTWVGLNTTMAHIGVIGGYIIWRRVVNRYGPARSLRFAVPLAASYPFLVSFFPYLSLILVWGILINLVNPGVSLSHVSMLYRLCPPERRASYMALYATISSVGAFVAPMLGVALSNVIDIRWILLMGGAIRLIGAGLFHLYKIEAPEGAVTS